MMVFTLILDSQKYCVHQLFLYIKKRMTAIKIILTPTTKEPKVCHAMATTSAFNLKLCHT